MHRATLPCRLIVRPNPLERDAFCKLDVLTLVPGIDELPALKDGQTWVSKFRNIVDYVRQYSREEWDLDADWDGLDKADVTAYASVSLSFRNMLLNFV